MVSSTAPSGRRSSSLHRLSSSVVRQELDYETIVHASIVGRTLGCHVATTISFNNATAASQKRKGPAVVRIPPFQLNDDSSDTGSSECSTCSCDDCRDGTTGTMTPSTIAKSAPRTPRDKTPTRATRSTASALPITSKLLSPPSRKVSSRRPSSVPPTVSRPTSAPVQARRSSISPPLERYLSHASSPSEANSLRSQQGSVVSKRGALSRRPSSAPVARAVSSNRPSPSSPISPSLILRYGEFHPVRDSSKWNSKNPAHQRSSPEKRYSSPRHNVMPSKKGNFLASPNFESCQGSTAVGLSSTSASTAMMTKFPAWQHEQQRQHQGPTPIITEGLHAAAWGQIRMASSSPRKPNVRGGSSKTRHPSPLQPSEPSVVDLECGTITPCSITKEKSDNKLGETSNSMKIIGLNNCAIKLRFTLVIIVTFLLLLASLALYYDLKVAKKETV